MDYLVIVPPYGAPYMRMQAEDTTHPPDSVTASLLRGEFLALEYFAAWRTFYDLLHTRGASVAERFADELHLHLTIRNPPAHAVIQGDCHEPELLIEALAATIAFPNPACRGDKAAHAERIRMLEQRYKDQE